MNDTAAVVAPPAVAIPTEAGAPFAGGLYVARFFLGRQAYALVVATKDEGELKATAWGSTKKEVTGALSCTNGLANTLAMEAAGCAPAKWARALRVGDFDDWYIPSRIEALILFAELREQFERDWYWTSTQFAGGPEWAWYQTFFNGDQSNGHKRTKLRARAVRRVPIQ